MCLHGWASCAAKICLENTYQELLVQEECVATWIDLHATQSLEPSTADLQPHAELPQTAHSPQRDTNQCLL